MKKKFKIYFKCACCRGNFYFTTGFKHKSSMGISYYICKECEVEPKNE